jgi:hypothetical protein
VIFEENETEIVVAKIGVRGDVTAALIDARSRARMTQADGGGEGNDAGAGSVSV